MRTTYIVCYHDKSVQTLMDMPATFKNKPKLAQPKDDLERYTLLSSQARKYAQSIRSESSRLSTARAYCALVLSAYWAVLTKDSCWDITALELDLPSLSKNVERSANELGVLIATFPPGDAGYLIGSIYTAMLPQEIRSGLGAYYTPPPMVERLLDLAERAGTDFSCCSAIDTSCGGGAFLAPVATRMLKHTREPTAERILKDIATRLQGIELDPFAAWMTQVLLEVALISVCLEAKMRFPCIVTVADALKCEHIGKFDLVIGNPPYGRVKIDEETRVRYSRSLYGHANLYGLFTDLALRLTKPEGVIAYLTPTSFLGGQYFKSLRKLLVHETTPMAFDFIADREGVFEDVLQETILATYRAHKSKRAADVSLLIPKGLEKAEIEPVGSIRVPLDGSPWVIPRTAEDSTYVKLLTKMPTRLSDFGYQVSTGPLVWNRHKPQLRKEKLNGENPVIWAESVTTNGFHFSAARRNHIPYIKLSDQPHLITQKACILLQRTTAKEQEKRLLGAIMPQAFIDDFGGVVVENHLNIISAKGSCSIALKTLCTILNSKAVDRAFRCISGSVAVSAYELEALPLPSTKQAKSVEALLKKGAGENAVENLIASFYQRAVV